MILETDLAAYFLDVATKNKLIAHTEQKPRFVVGKDLANAQMKNQLAGDGYLVVLEALEGSIENNTADTTSDFVPVRIYIVKKIKETSYTLRQEAFDGAKTILKQILSRMIRDKRKAIDGIQGILQYWQPQTTTYIKVEGEMVQNVFGYAIDFDFIKPLDLQYNPAEWN